MPLTNEELLRKATLDTTDFGGAGEAPLSVEQVKQFLRVMITPQVMLPDVRTVTANANKWQESKIEFGSRVMKPGVEGTRLADADRVAPTTGIVEISTVLIRGEIPVTDEVMEDQVEQAGFGDTLVSMIAEAAGRDVEELFINGDTASGDAYLALQEGWLELVRNTGNVVASAGFGQDYQEIFKQLLVAIPDRFKRDLQNFRFYVPQRLEEKYRDVLSARGTPLGDLTLTGTSELRYQGILIKGVPLMAIVAGTPDTSNILLTHRQNLYAGYRRMIKLESWRDPREGATSFVVTARVNSQCAHTPAAAIATSVSVEP
jgi:HK97 family phage major capsid protein